MRRGDRRFFRIVVADQQLCLQWTTYCLHDSALHWKVAIQWAFRVAAEEADRSSESVPLRVLEGNCSGSMIFTDDTDASGLRAFVTDKNIGFDQASITMPKRQRAADFEKSIRR